MKTDSNNLIKGTMIIGSCLIIIGAVFKISHWKGGIALTILGFLILAIYEVMTIKKTK